jgi:hypothetical protein
MKDVTVVGGGIVGLATAYTLLESGKASVRLLEKEAAVARHQSTHNSGVLHAGLQYQPASEKARLAREGIRRMTEFCAHHRIPHEICGKLVVAVTDAESRPPGRHAGATDRSSNRRVGLGSKTGCGSHEGQPRGSGCGGGCGKRRGGAERVEMADGVRSMTGWAARGGGGSPLVEGKNRAQSSRAVGRD